MKSLAVIAAATLVALVGAQAVRQIQGGMKLRIPADRPPITFLNNPKVRSELKVTPQQWSKIELIAAPGKLKPQDNWDSAYLTVKKVLTPVQVARLEEVHRQSNGLYSLSYPPYGRLAGITTAQAEKITEVYSGLMSEAVSAQMAAMPPGGTNVRLSLSPAQRVEIRQNLTLRSRSILTAAQWRKWQSILGKPSQAVQ